MAKDRGKRKYCTFKTFKSSPLAKTFTNILKCNFYESCKILSLLNVPRLQHLPAGVIWAILSSQVLTFWHKDITTYYHVFD